MPSNLLKRNIPEIVSGYELSECEFGKFSVIIPWESENKFRNPSFEVLNDAGTGIYDVTPINAAMSWGYTYAYRGFKGGSAGASTAGAPYGALIEYFDFSAGTFTFSIYVKPDRAGKAKLFIRYTKTAPPTVVDIHQRYYDLEANKWQRIFITFTHANLASLADNIYAGIVMDAVNTDDDISLDCAQMEKLSFMSTYFDGDMSGFVYNKTEYYWKAEPNKSTSVRRGTTRSGGREFPFSELGLYVAEVNGLGMPAINNIMTEISTGGSFFQKTVYGTREFNINGYVAGRNANELRKSKRMLDYVFSPFTSAFTQELLLRFYDPQDNSNFVNIPAHFANGLSGQTDNLYAEKLSLQFIQSQPIIETEQQVVERTLTLGSININGIVRRDISGEYELIGELVDGEVKCAARLPDGKIYFGGSFTSINGDSDLAYCARYNPDTEGWESLLPNLGGTVNIIGWQPGMEPAVRLVVGGEFEDVDGTVGDSYLLGREVYTGSSWINFGVPNGPVTAMSGALSYLFIAGQFDTVDGVSTGTVAKYSLYEDLWYQFAGGETRTFIQMFRTNRTPPNPLEALNLYFIQGAVANGEICKYNWDTDSLDTINTADTGFSWGAVVPNTYDDFILGGNFRDTTYITANNVILYHEGQWYEYGGGVGSGSVGEGIDDITTSDDGSIYISGTFSEAGGVAIQGGLSQMVGGSFRSMAIYPNDPLQKPSEITYNGYEGALYISYPPSADGTAIVSVLLPVFNEGTFPSYPIFRVDFYDTNTGFDEDGIVYQITSTRDGSYVGVSGYQVDVGEKFIVDMTGGKIQLTNNYGEDLNDYLLPGSSLIKVYPGENRFAVSCTNDAMLYVCWQKNFIAVDDMFGKLSDLIGMAMFTG